MGAAVRWDPRAWPTPEAEYWAALDGLARRAVLYFIEQTERSTGLTKDRSSASSPASIAACGFALAAWVTAVERGWMARPEGEARAARTLQTFLELPHEHGFWYHFLDPHSGVRVWNCELSSIDTALFLLGVMTAREYFGSERIARPADALCARVDFPWMCAGGPHLHMGWTPERGFIRATWSSYNELIALLVPALGSPTHPVPPEAWRAWERPLREGVRGPVVYCRGGDPLFVHYYAQLWIDLRGRWDGLVDYHANTAEAIALNQAFCAEASGEHPGYDAGREWGLSASDGPCGYRAYGAWPGAHDGTLAPYAVAGALPWHPKLAFSTLRHMYARHGEAIWGPYGFWSAYNAERGWFSQEAIGIDAGTVLLGVIAAQDGLVWRATARHPFIRRGLAAAGFGAAPPGLRLAPALWRAGVTA